MVCYCTRTPQKTRSDFMEFACNHLQSKHAKVQDKVKPAIFTSISAIQIMVKVRFSIRAVCYGTPLLAISGVPIILCLLNWILKRILSCKFFYIIFILCHVSSCSIDNFLSWFYFLYNCIQFVTFIPCTCYFDIVFCSWILSYMYMLIC